MGKDAKIRKSRSAREVRPAPGAPESLDPLDERIIDCLRRDGRMPSLDIAKEVGANVATVRSRIRRLENSGAMRVVTMVEKTLLGFNYMYGVGIQVKGRSVDAVADELAAIPQILTVMATIGPNDIEIQLVARSLEEAAALLTDTIGRIEGVARITPVLNMRILKFQTDWVRF